jgi:hypothetical protein
MISWIKLGVTIAYEIYDEAMRERRRRKQAEKWAGTVSAPRACHRCKEIAYIPGQVACTKCGGLL